MTTGTRYGTTAVTDSGAGDEMDMVDQWTMVKGADDLAAERAVTRRAQLKLIRTEARLALREPAGVIFGIGLPVVLIVIFGNLPTFRSPDPSLGGMTPLEVYLPLLIVLSMSLIGMTTLPGPLATYREQRILRRLATTPISPARVLAAQFAVTGTMALISLGLLLGLGAGAFGLSVPRQPAGFALTVLLGLAGLLALGMWIAAIAPTGRAAQYIGGGLFYPMQFLAGLWLPQQGMPPVLRDISECSPLGAMVNAMQSSIDGSFPAVRELLVLAAYAVGFALLAVRQFSWD